MTNFIGIRVQGQRKIEHLIHGIKAALDTRRILDEGAALLFNRMRQNFLKEMSPTGEQWPRSKAAIMRGSMGMGIGGGTLYATGHLFRSLQLFADSENSRTIGTNATSDKGFPYPKVHQFGLGGMTERVFLGFAQEDVSIMTRVIVRRLQTELA